MKWIPIDPDNLPDGEVLAACFDKNSPNYKDKFIGYLNFGHFGLQRQVYCDNNGTQFLNSPTHYIDINQYDL